MYGFIRGRRGGKRRKDIERVDVEFEGANNIIAGGFFAAPVLLLWDGWMEQQGYKINPEHRSSFDYIIGNWQAYVFDFIGIQRVQHLISNTLFGSSAAPLPLLIIIYVVSTPKNNPPFDGGYSW